MRVFFTCAVFGVRNKFNRGALYGRDVKINEKRRDNVYVYFFPVVFAEDPVKSIALTRIPCVAGVRGAFGSNPPSFQLFCLLYLPRELLSVFSQIRRRIHTAMWSLGSFKLTGHRREAVKGDNLYRGRFSRRTLAEKRRRDIRPCVYKLRRRSAETSSGGSDM
ncbi:hypothetical protein EVAR_7015_1 [Eumeta japonica]|uniref:Uncharacterized protein n=1 Tax=Eumeta variegata TaxID=151549 RepID=A0A4C1TJA9_EUMVA|nr:hypothetical protein EVAR_7015_1 [Eumeta japonica]